MKKNRKRREERRMKSTSTTNLNQALIDMVNSEIGIALLSADGGNEQIYKKTSEKNHYTERIAGFAGKQLVAYQIYQLNYSCAIPSADTIEMRNDAIQNIFCRWNALGYNQSHAKNPYNSKNFAEFLDSLEFTKSDYLLLRIA